MATILSIEGQDSLGGLVSLDVSCNQPFTTAQHELKSDLSPDVVAMKDGLTKAPDTVEVHTIGREVDNQAIPQTPKASPSEPAPEIVKDVDGETNNGETRSDSEAETVVLSGKDSNLTDTNPKAIKHEGKNGVDTTADRGINVESATNGEQDDESVLATDRKKINRDPGNTTTADASYSSNLSSTASSPAQEERSPSKATSDPENLRTKDSRDAHPKDIIPRKRKLRVDDTDEKGQQRRRNRATSSETANKSDRKDTRRASKGRSESPVTRPRHRAQSSQSIDAQGIQKRRKPPPLQVNQRRKASEDGYGSDDSGSANGRPQLRKLVSSDNFAMSPAKLPHKKHRDKNGRTWLARACALNDLDTAILRLHERPEDINVPDNAGNTPLQIVSLDGRAELVKMLLEAGCEITCQNVDGDTPLIDAVENGHLDVIKLLLAAGVDPRQRNQKGEGPLDLLKPTNPDYGPIKAALEEAKGQYTGRRVSEDQHMQPNAGRDSISMHSPRASPSLHATRSPPPPAHGLVPRRTARSEVTPNYLLWINSTPEELRKRAGMGDIEGVDHILNMRPMADVEAVLVAAKGGHDLCLSVLIAMGQPPHDPEPLHSSQYKAGHNTPMLAAIGGGHIGVINTLLGQSGFDPTRRIYRNLTYYEIAKERQGDNWQEEYDILKDAYDRHMASKSKGATSSKQRGTVAQREQKVRRHDSSSPSSLRSVKRQSPDSTSKDWLPKKKRPSEVRHGQVSRDGELEAQIHDSGRDRLRVTPKQDSRESSVVVSDRETIALVRHREKKRSFSDAGISAVNENGLSKPKKRLVSSKIIKEDEEKKRRASLASSSSSQDQIRSNAGAGRKGSSIGRHDSREGANVPLSETHKKRSFHSISPSESNSLGTRRSSDVPKKLKRQRVNSIGTAIDREPPGLLQLGPARVANMISPPYISSPPQSKGAAPVAFMGKSSTSPVKERSNPFIHRTDNSSPIPDLTIEVLAHAPSYDPEPQIVYGDKKRLSEAPSVPENVKIEVEDGIEERERQRLEQGNIEQKAKENAAQMEAERIAREVEAARAEEEARVKEAERKIRQEKEAEEARIEKKRQDEEAQQRLIEREKVRKEEQERKRAEQEERERIMMIRRQEEEERRRRQNLPNALKVAAELSPESAKHPSEIMRWLPLYTAFGYQLDPQCEEQAREERWITNIQAAPILAITDLDLSQCKQCSSSRDSTHHILPT